MNSKPDENIPFEERQYTSAYKFQSALLHPKHWPLWGLMALLFLVGRLPFDWVVKLGRMVGRLFMKLGGSRVAVTRRNLELCFPEKTPEEREQLLCKNFEAIGIACFEPGVAWFSSSKRIAKLGTETGLADIISTINSGQGVLISALHMTTIEMACRLISEQCSFNILYRVHNNPVYEYVSNRCRISYRHKSRFIPRKQVRDIVHFMSQGEIGIILPDQDMGRGRSIFLPFFGIPAATITSTSDFSRLSDSAVFFTTAYLDENNRYVMISKRVENFPTSDSIEDTKRIVQLTEQAILNNPDQYLWQHRRFKTRPEGEPSLYSRKEKKKSKRHID